MNQVYWEAYTYGYHQTIYLEHPSICEKFKPGFLKL